MAEWNWVDYILLGIVLASTIISLFRGFFRESLSLAAWVIALWAVWQFGDVPAGGLSKWISDPVILSWASRGVVFIGTLLISGLLSKAVAIIVSSAGLSGLDRLLGTFFGCARGVLLVGVLLAVLHAMGFNQSAWWHESKLIPYAAPVSDFIRDLVQDGLGYLDDVDLPDPVE